MRKLLATIVCWFLAFSLGYTLLPTSFSALINWLGPVFGTSLHLILSTLFLMLADPLKYTTLAIAWAAVGILCGLIIRKRIGSVLTALSVFSGQFIIVSLAGFRIFEIVGASGIMTSPEKILTLLPPVPAGASLGTILNAPIIGEIYQRVQGMSLQAFSPNLVIDLVVNTILLSVLKNVAIVCIAALVGCELGKLITRPFKPKIESFRMHFVKSPSPTVSRFLILGLIVLLASSSAASMHLVSVEAATGKYYSETLLATLTPRGTVIVTANFFDTVYLLKGIDVSASAFAGCIAASLSAQRLNLESISGDISMFSSQNPLQQFGINIEQALGMYSIMPSTMLVLVYKNVPSNTAQDRANSAADIFAKEYGTSFTQLIAMPQTMGGGELIIAVYQSDVTFEKMSNTIMGSLPETQRDGIASLIGLVYRNGIFTPRETSRSANGTIISTGFVNTGALLSMAGDEGPMGSVKPFLPNLGGLVPFVNVLSYFASRFHSSPVTIHSLKFSDILNTDAPIKFSPSTNASTVMSVIPMGNTTKAGEMAAPIIKMATTLPESAINMLVSTIVGSIIGTNITSIEDLPPELVSLAVETIAAGGTIDPSFLEIIFTSRFPLQLRLVKAVSVAEIDRFGTVTITVTAYNDDVDRAQNITIDDTSTLMSYSQGAKLISGSNTKTWDSISNRTASGSGTRSISYTVKLLKEGTYTLPAAVVSYVYDGVKYMKLSDRVVVNVRGPNLIQVLTEGIPYAWALMTRMINMIPMAQGNGSLILTAALIAAVCIIVVLEYRGFRKWIRGGEAKREDKK